MPSITILLFVQISGKLANMSEYVNILGKVSLLKWQSKSTYFFSTLLVAFREEPDKKILSAKIPSPFHPFQSDKKGISPISKIRIQDPLFETIN